MRVFIKLCMTALIIGLCAIPIRSFALSYMRSRAPGGYKEIEAVYDHYAVKKGNEGKHLDQLERKDYVLYFKYSVDGKEYMAKDDEIMVKIVDGAPAAIDQTIDIMYNPEDPSDYYRSAGSDEVKAFNVLLVPVSLVIGFFMLRWVWGRY